MKSNKLPSSPYNHIPLTSDFNNWWYSGRKKILEYIIKNEGKKEKFSILEIGPGVGVNIEVLQTYGVVDILEIDQYFIELIQKNKKLNVRKFFNQFSEITQKYDLIVFLDVLEHIEDHQIFLKEISYILNHDGIGIMSVPAYDSLWSEHDKNLHHFRRYNWSLINEQVDQKFNLYKKFGYNFILLPVRYLQIKLSKKPHSDMTLNRYLNSILKTFVNLEIRFLKLGINPKFGLSLFAVLKKN
jgi:SAM-dependent methyltransferase